MKESTVFPILPLGKICILHSGGTPRRSNNKYYGGNIPWAKIADLDTENGIVVDTEEYITVEGLQAINNRIFPKGSILLAMYGSIGKLAIAGRDISCNQAILGIQIKDKEHLDINYLRLWLTSIRATLEFQGRGVTQQNISKSIVEKLEIPLPPLEEQRRIAAILDKADGVRRKRKEAIRLTEELLKSTFLEMLGNLFSFVKPEIKEHPKGFLKCLLGDQITLQRGFDLAKSQCKEGAIPVISSGGVSAYHSEAKAKGPGVLLGRKGSVGRVHYIESDYWPHDTTLWIREFNENIPIFVYYFFKEFPISNFEESTANPTLNRNRLHPLEVFWPSGETQNKFAEIFVSSMEYQRREKAYLAESENLFNSLLQRAFRGEL
jgi:type I restriction enzyme S subunit